MFNFKIYLIIKLDLFEFKCIQLYQINNKTCIFFIFDKYIDYIKKVEKLCFYVFVINEFKCKNKIIKINLFNKNNI